MSRGGRPVEPLFAVGDRVVADADIGGIWRPRVRRDDAGVVVAIAPGGELEVHFDSGQRELVEPTSLRRVNAA